MASGTGRVVLTLSKAGCRELDVQPTGKPPLYVPPSCSASLWPTLRRGISTTLLHLRWALDAALLLAVLALLHALHIAPPAPLAALPRQILPPGGIGPQQLRIYVPPLPARYLHQFYDRFSARDGAPYCSVGDCSHAAAFAAPLGVALEPPSLSLLDTDQFSNDLWWYSQLLSSPLRVHTYEEADVVFVPGIFARADPAVESEAPFHTAFVDFFHEYMPFLPNVSDKPHVIGYPRVAWPEARRFAEMPSMAPFVFTALEPFTAFKDPASIKCNQQIVVVPYQSHIHFSRGVGEAAAAFDAAAAAASKSLLASGSFRSRKEMRIALAAQCGARPGQCAHHEFEPGNRTDLLASLDLTRKSWYCLQPPGDTPSRAALYDCVLAGAIPAVFDYNLLEAMPFNDLVAWYEAFVFLPWGELNATGRNAIDALAEQHSPERALGRLQALSHIQHLLQYSLDPLHELIRFDEAWAVHPRDDAFTASWKAILRNLCTAGRLSAAKCCTSRAFAEQAVDACGGAAME